MEAVVDPANPLNEPRRRLPVMPVIELGVLAAAIAIGVATYFIITADPSSPRPVTPPLVAVLMVANLVPAVALMMLVGRRIALRRAAASAAGGQGRLHVRLVALFSVLASVPMILVTIVASLLFQYGVEFWYSDRARGMLENASALAQTAYSEMLRYVDRENVTMAGDLAATLKQTPIDDQGFQILFAQQVYYRNLSEAAIVTLASDGEMRSIALVNPAERDLNADIKVSELRQLSPQRPSIASANANQIQSVTTIPGTQYYLWAARTSDNTQIDTQRRRAKAVLDDYSALRERSQMLQLQFNLMLLAISLVIVGLAVFAALAIADRLVRPVNDLVDAARRVAGGNFDARVAQPKRMDEVGTLAGAFNTMTERLKEQTASLVSANAEAESRRALIEAVMSGVTAGVISLDQQRDVRLINSSAASLLQLGESSAIGRPLSEVAPELHALLVSDQREAVVQVTRGGEARTLAVKITRDGAGPILTFDDITQQLADQRRAAWADVARRIAHEIKNPLTPIQLAAERLQRRYGRNIDESDTTFARLTETIVRQVGDLRRMVDEFSSFARMPKPVFRRESLVDIARQSLFLHEVAHPEIIFRLEQDSDAPMTLVCDRRQIGQALTNIIKNAAEAVLAREGDELPQGEVVLSLDKTDGRVTLNVADNGVGLPLERDRIVEPYMTTRSRGTGLGLAIVKKIAEEHLGTIGFSDRPDGGTIVTLTFDARMLATLAVPDDADPAPADDEDRLQMLTRNRTSAP